MSRYIDAEWLSKLFPDTGEGDWTYNATALGYINSAPSIDIVRCKECKWRGIPTACPIDNFYAQRWTKDDDFCSYGKRKESE